jgi:SAM-dependent methyltransferase
MSQAVRQDNIIQVAQFWNRVAHEFDAIYSGDKSAIGRALDRWLRADMYGRFDWVLTRAGEIAADRVCDIGCGSGRFVSALARRGASRVLGIDVAPEMIALARRLVEQQGVAERCEFVLGDIAGWTGDETFDLTIAIGFWDYIADPSGRLQTIRRMTAGRFLSAWPRFWTWRMPVRKARLAARGCPVYFFRRNDIERLLRAAGFRVERISVIGKLFCVEAV